MEIPDHTVALINGIAEVVHDTKREIGKLVDGLVAVIGGVKYGKQTLGRLAEHPTLMFSVEHLRRCWQYYRLTAQYAADVQKVAPSLSYSHMYQLSRLLDIEDEKDQRDAVLAMAKQAAEKRMTVTKLANSVSTHLKSIGKAIRGKAPSKGTDKGAKNGASTDVYEALLDTATTVVEATKQIVVADTITRVVDLRNATHMLGFAYVQLVGRLASGDADTLSDAKKVADALAVAIKNVDEKEGCANGKA